MNTHYNMQWLTGKYENGENLLGFALMEVRDFLSDFGHFDPLENALLPPWKKFPGISPHDMFWRMGQGEEYQNSFNQYYAMLTDREKTICQLTNPSPYEWDDYYNQ